MCVEVVFVECGFVGVSIVMIVECVGLLKVNVYYYFLIKFVLYCCVFDDLFEDWYCVVGLFEVGDDLVEVIGSYVCVKMVLL